MDIAFRAHRDYAFGTVALYIGRIDEHTGRLTVASKIDIDREVEEGQACGYPTAHLTHRSAQELIDELWNCGVRPSSGEGSTGQLAATERHLNDMRAMVFKAGMPGRSSGGIGGGGAHR